MSLFRPTTSLSTYFSQAPRTLQPDAAEFVPGGIPAALHQQQYPYPQISYQYGAIPTNFMAPWAHRGTAQYLPPQHPNSFPHAHMMPSQIDFHTEVATAQSSPVLDGDKEQSHTEIHSHPVVAPPIVPDGCLRPITTTESQVAAPRTSASAADIVHAPRQTMPATKSGKSAEKNINASSHSPLPEPIEKKDRKSVASLITVVRPSSVDHCQDQNLLRTSREVVNEATAPAKIRDSWEDVSTVAAPPLGKDILQKQPINGILSMTPRTYTKSELFELRLQRSTSPPPDLPSFLVGVSTAGDFRGVRRLGPGGTTRGGGAGAGGGGSGGTGPRYTGSMEDPRRDQTFRRGIESTRGGRHRKTEHTAAAHKWDRGHRVKQKDCSQDHWGPEAVEPLKTTFHRWDRKHKHANELEGSLNTVTAILNKMTPQSFEKLSGQLCKLEMTSSEMLRRVIGVIFDKAVDEPHFAVVYAALCARLAEETRVWPFIRSVKDESTGLWSWIADLDVDTSKLRPLPKLSSVDLLLSSPDNDFEEIGIGQLQLHPSDCFLKNNTLVCCYFAEQRPGVVFAVVQDAEARLFDNGKSKLFGTFATKADAQQDAMKKASFKRLLLNQCQEEFERNVRSSGGSAALEAAAREARDNAKQAAIDATRAAAEQGVPPKELPDELELEIWITKLKRRMLGNVKFIGELFKQQLLKEKIMHECIKLLLGSLDDPNAVPDDESIEAAAKLFLTIGKQLESPAASKAKLDAYCKRLSVLSRDKTRLAARTRFMLQDLLECRRNGWRERRAKDGPHKLGTKASTTQGKGENQSRRDEERNLARERQRQAISQQQQQQRRRLLSAKDVSSKSQDARQSRHSQASTVRILSRDQETTSSAHKSASDTYDTPLARPAAKDTAELWTDDRAQNRARSSLDEFAQLQDQEELIASLDEVPNTNRVYKHVFELIVGRIVEGKDAERNSSLAAIHALALKSKLKAEDVTDALGNTIEFLSDICIDSPMAVEHVAKLVSVCLELKIIDIAWLTANSRLRGDDPKSDGAFERNALFELLTSTFANYPEASELKSQLKY